MNITPDFEICDDGGGQALQILCGGNVEKSTRSDFQLGSKATVRTIGGDGSREDRLMLLLAKKATAENSSALRGFRYLELVLAVLSTNRDLIHGVQVCNDDHVPTSFPLEWCGGGKDHIRGSRDQGQEQ
jgi:hypothetical protein